MEMYVMRVNLCDKQDWDPENKDFFSNWVIDLIEWVRRSLTPNRALPIGHDYPKGLTDWPHVCSAATLSISIPLIRHFLSSETAEAEANPQMRF